MQTFLQSSKLHQALCKKCGNFVTQYTALKSTNFQVPLPLGDVRRFLLDPPAPRYPLPHLVHLCSEGTFNATSGVSLPLVLILNSDSSSTLPLSRPSLLRPSSGVFGHLRLLSSLLPASFMMECHTFLSTRPHMVRPHFGPRKLPKA